MVQQIQPPFHDGLDLRPCHLHTHCRDWSTKVWPLQHTKQSRKYAFTVPSLMRATKASNQLFFCWAFFTQFRRRKMLLLSRKAAGGRQSAPPLSPKSIYYFNCEANHFNVRIRVLTCASCPTRFQSQVFARWGGVSDICGGTFTRNMKDTSEETRVIRIPFRHDVASGHL